MQRSKVRHAGGVACSQLTIDDTGYRYFEDHAERIPVLAAELVALKPDLLIGLNPQAAVAFKSATATIPIVFVAVFDPVELGLVQSLSRPGKPSGVDDVVGSFEIRNPGVMDMRHHDGVGRARRSKKARESVEPTL
jgi:hypothetical protein